MGSRGASAEGGAVALDRREARRRPHRPVAGPAPAAASRAGTPSLSPALAALEAAFARLNAALFGGALGPAVIATPPRGSRAAWAWYRPAGWSGGADTLAEIGVAAEGLRRTPDQILLALLVQMVRHANAGAGIKDAASRGRRLNRRFARAARAAGLDPPERPDRRTGYADCRLGPRALAAVGTLRPTLAAACALARRPSPSARAGGFAPYECGCVGVPKVWTYRRRFERTQCPDCGARYRRARRAE